MTLEQGLAFTLPQNNPLLSAPSTPGASGPPLEIGRRPGISLPFRFRSAALGRRGAGERGLQARLEGPALPESQHLRPPHLPGLWDNALDSQVA